MNGHMITLYDNHSHLPLLWTHLIPATLEGRALHNVQNAMFAAALAFNMDVDLENIRHGLRTFDTTFFQAPGRMNVYSEHAFKVILDYAHNAAAVKAMVDVVGRLDVTGRRIVVLAAPGDRRDIDIQEVAKAAAGHFDLYICRRDDNRRGRGEGELPKMLQATLLEAGVEASKILVINDEQESIQAALSRAEAGDLLLILGDEIKRCWKQIIYFQSDSAAPAGESSPPRVPSIDLPDFELDAGVELVRDERGVRIAAEIAD
jgi:cyanophycin synthetase